jgi:hypothetical protein
MLNSAREERGWADCLARKIDERMNIPAIEFECSSLPQVTTAARHPARPNQAKSSQIKVNQTNSNRKSIRSLDKIRHFRFPENSR